jgi:hypothetical protein
MAGFKSEAVSSQGTRLGVQGGQVAPVTAPITAITAANPPVFTAANTFGDGDVVEIADVQGMVEINGAVGVATSVTPTGFSLEGVDATGFGAYTSGGVATGIGTGNFDDVCEARNFTGFDGQASEIDVTTMCSEAMEFRPGLQDFGAFNFTMNYVPSDPAQKTMQAAKADGTILWWRLVLPEDDTGESMGVWLFQAFVRQMTLSGGVNAALESNVVLRITGAPIFIEGPTALEADAQRAGRRGPGREQQQPQYAQAA